MATRLLSLLSEIEQALRKESAANMGPTWDSLRTVNYKSGLARLTLTTPPDAVDEAAAPGGTIFLQSFLLADGSQCLKVNLGWTGVTATSLIAIYAKPQVNWLSEARLIASSWLAGPPVQAAIPAELPAETPTEMLEASPASAEESPRLAMTG